ncbi:MAG TPA: PHP domain-containing protein [Gemmatimonadaceae bacterium]
MTPSTRDARSADSAFVDLHMHSTASDGSLPAVEVVEAAARARLAAIALTDHDTLAGIPEAREAGGRLGVRVVPGVELSAHDEGEVHLLGLHMSRLDELESRLAGFREARRTRAEQIVRRLNELGLPVTMDAVLENSGKGAIGRPHVARAIVSLGRARDQREAFDRWLGFGKPAYVEKEYLAVRDAIALVHEAGGIAVLAHPGASATRARLEELRALGMDGVEVRHPSHTAEDVARIGALAEHFGLLPSGGSDWHGASAGQRTIGCMNVPGSWLEKQDDFLRERRKRERVA